MSIAQASKPSSVDGMEFPNEVKCFYDNKNGKINITVNGHYSKDFDKIIDYLSEKRDEIQNTVCIESDFGTHFCSDWSIEMISELHEIVRYSIMFKYCIKPIK